MAAKYSKQLFIIIIAAGAILALLYGVWFQINVGKSQEKMVLKTGTLFNAPRNIDAFSLIDTHNQAFTQKNLQTKWSLVFFGFTHCPHICPTTLSVLNHVEKRLALNRVSVPQVVFISVDPARDNPQQIAQYLQQFNPNFVGLTGSQAQIEALAKAFSVIYMQMNAGDQQHASIDHSGTIMLTNPAGKIVAIFSPPHNVDDIAADVRAIILHYQGA